MKMDIGIGENGRKAVAEALAGMLADSYTLLVKTHGFHWNVVGPAFPMLHELFGKQYTELQSAVDEVAERIRALGHPAPGSFAAFAKLAKVPEQSNVPSAEEMIAELLADNELLARRARDVFEVAEEAEDDASVDLMVERMTVHDKNAWMLRAQLE